MGTPHVWPPQGLPAPRLHRADTGGRVTLPHLPPPRVPRLPLRTDPPSGGNIRHHHSSERQILFILDPGGGGAPRGGQFGSEFDIYFCPCSSSSCSSSCLMPSLSSLTSLTSHQRSSGTPTIGIGDTWSSRTCHEMCSFSSLLNWSSASFSSN